MATQLPNIKNYRSPQPVFCTGIARGYQCPIVGKQKMEGDVSQ